MATIFKTGLTALIVLIAASGAALAAKPEVYVKRNWDYALNGFDATSYFDGEPIKGDPQYSAKIANGTYIFASQENLDKFLSDPDAYRPAYGGYCAYALGARGALAHGDPKVWTVHEGVLYLNFSRGVQKKWLPKKEEYIEAADALWPEILNKK